MIPKTFRRCFGRYTSKLRSPTVSGIHHLPDSRIGRPAALANFSEVQIMNAIRNEGRLSLRSANFWAHVYGVPLDEVARFARGVVAASLLVRTRTRSC